MQLRTPGPARAAAALLLLLLAGCVGGDPAQPPATPRAAWDAGEVGALHNELVGEFYRLDHETGHQRPKGEILTRVANTVAARRGRPELAVTREQVEELEPRMRTAIEGLHAALSSGEPAQLGAWFEGVGIPGEVGWRLLPAAHRPLGRQLLRPYEEMSMADREQLDRAREVHAASADFWRDRMPPDDGPVDGGFELGHRLDEQDAIMLADAVGAISTALYNPLLAPLGGSLASIAMEEVLGEQSEDPQPVCTCSCTCDCCGGDEDSGG